MLAVNNELESWLTGTAYLVANSFKPLSSESLIEGNNGPSSVDEDDTNYSDTDSNLRNADSTASFARSSSGGRGDGTMISVGMEVTPSPGPCTDLGVTRTNPWIGLAKCQLEVGFRLGMRKTRYARIDNIGTAMTSSRTSSRSSSSFPVRSIVVISNLKPEAFNFLRCYSWAGS